MNKKRILLAFVVLAFVVGVFVYCGQWRSGKSEQAYSGVIEATQANLSFQVGGRVFRVPVQEGQAVKKDQVLAELDLQEFQSRHDQAKANLDRASAVQAQAETLHAMYRKTLPADVARAEAGVKALRAHLAELRAGTRTQEIERARQAWLAAQAVLADAQKTRDRYETLFRNGAVSEKERDAVCLRFETALRDREGRKEAYDLAREGVRPETIQAAEARLAEGEAGLRQARSALGRIDAARKEAAAAAAQVQAAKAALDQAFLQLTYAQLKAPGDGIVTSRSVEPGEVVTPGREVLTVADLAAVDVKIFVPETDIGRVKPGQDVDVKVDTFPDRVFRGKVAFVSPEGEFTPKIIQTKKERVKLVYLVKVSVPNPEMALKSGMPADAWLR